MKFSSNDIEIVNTKVVYDGFHRYEVLDLRFKLFNGNWSDIITREVFKKRRAVGVLLFDPIQDDIILAQQFRVGTIEEEDSLWQTEVIAGLIDAGFTPEETAYKESHEESELQVLQLEPISKYWLSPGSSNEFFYLYCGCVDSTNMPSFTGLKQENEDIHLVRLKASEAIEKMIAGDMDNAATIISLQWMQSNYHRISTKWKKLLKDNKGGSIYAKNT